MGIGRGRLALDVALAGSLRDSGRVKRGGRWLLDTPARPAAMERGVGRWVEDAPSPLPGTAGGARRSSWGSRSPWSSCGGLFAPDRMMVLAVGLDLARRAEMSRFTPRTARHVLAGQPEKDLLPALRGGGRSRFRRDPQEPAAERDAFSPHGVGEETIVAEPDEPGRKYME